ncbi:hypothetical protein NUW54_g14070 [Trametes sanguinea]|uniref:Uncharacterized protein n=1 Tax=Trametes sanguinea TaxID=158606 RepID=A0ACC1MF04_9APHY|nr:hypothetical protein NUW54_g14070 [Trametes sanguinea]
MDCPTARSRDTVLRASRMKKTRTSATTMLEYRDMFMRFLGGGIGHRQPGGPQFMYSQLFSEQSPEDPPGGELMPEEDLQDEGDPRLPALDDAKLSEESDEDEPSVVLDPDLIDEEMDYGYIPSDGEDGADMVGEDASGDPDAVDDYEGFAAP